jgi:type III restriction enzyme
MQLKKIEQAKIDCAKRLFNEVSTSRVRYEAVSDYRKMLDAIAGMK